MLPGIVFGAEKTRLTYPLYLFSFEQGRTLLHNVCLCMGSVSIVESLLDYGVAIEEEADGNVSRYPYGPQYIFVCTRIRKVSLQFELLGL